MLTEVDPQWLWKSMAFKSGTKGRPLLLLLLCQLWTGDSPESHGESH